MEKKRCYENEKLKKKGKDALKGERNAYEQNIKNEKIRKKVNQLKALKFLYS